MVQNKATKRSTNSRQTIIVSWILVVLWAGFIFFMSSRTPSGLTNDLSILSVFYRWLQDAQAQVLGDGVDALSSIAHFCEYAVFGALLANALHYHMPLKRAVVLTVVCASLYGMTDEFHQLFVPGRMCDPLDWLVDTLGASLGCWLFYRVKRPRELQYSN